MVVLAINQRDVGAGMPKPARHRQSAKASADDDDFGRTPCFFPHYRSLYLIGVPYQAIMVR